MDGKFGLFQNAPCFRIGGKQGGFLCVRMFLNWSCPDVYHAEAHMRYWMISRVYLRLFPSIGNPTLHLHKNTFAFLCNLDLFLCNEILLAQKLSHDSRDPPISVCMFGA